MTFTINGRDLALVLGALSLGVLLTKSVEPAQAQEAAVTGQCKQYEISVWNPKNDMSFPGWQNVTVDANTWVAAPEGTEVLAPNLRSGSVTGDFFLKRCKQ
ncbi:MAG: hypothetical protein H6716_24760 [Polyangiaceae bacterium]|nr:hypothetical protein [Polyangiaceae bacterium]